MITPEANIKANGAPGRFRLPDIPDREPDEVTQYRQLFHYGRSSDLRVHLGNYDTTLMGADCWIMPEAEFDSSRGRYPDPLIAFDVDPQLYLEQDGYVISEQGKPPDFVLEVASKSTGRIDTVDKREAYAALGIPEYWRFDETGEFHGTKLAGDLLTGGNYEPIRIKELPGGVLEGYSRALNMTLRWEEEELYWHDPATGRRVASLEDERKARLLAEAEAEDERRARLESDARAEDAERYARELERQLRRPRQS